VSGQDDTTRRDRSDPLGVAAAAIEERDREQLRSLFRDPDDEITAAALRRRLQYDRDWRPEMSIERGTRYRVQGDRFRTDLPGQSITDYFALQSTTYRKLF